MKILADHCVHTDVILALRQAGFEVTRALEKGLARASDEEIFDYAQRHSMVILSFDFDFGNAVRFDIPGSQGVVLVYVERMSKSMILKRTVGFFEENRRRDLSGRLHLIEPHEVSTWPR